MLGAHATSSGARLPRAVVIFRTMAVVLIALLPRGSAALAFHFTLVHVFFLGLDLVLAFVFFFLLRQPCAALVALALATPIRLLHLSLAAAVWDRSLRVDRV